MQKVLNQVHATLLDSDDEDDLVTPCCFNVLKFEGDVKRVALNEESQMIEIVVLSDRGRKTETHRIPNLKERTMKLIKKRKAFLAQILVTPDGTTDVVKVQPIDPE